MEIEIKEFSYITYIPIRKEMYIRQSRIPLTNFENIFINFIIENNGYCNTNDFINYLKVFRRTHLNRKCLVVYINRLRNKIYFQTGEKIIKCKYGFGYILNP